MRVAVVGATGLVGGHTVAALERTAHDVVAISRSHGVDVLTGAGLAEALQGCDAVVDVSNTADTSTEGAREFFGTTTANLLRAEEAAGVPHHVALSIVGMDRPVQNGHYDGKRRQEELVIAGPVGWTILRATQFHEFTGQVLGWTTQDGVATLPPLLMQPVAAADVGAVLAELAVGSPQGVVELAGPATEDMVDLARRLLTDRGDATTRIHPTWHGAMFGPDFAGDVLLPGPDVRLADTTFDDWLAAGGDSAPG